MSAKKKARDGGKTVLFEIGVEELPPGFVESGKDRLKELVETILKEDGQMEFWKLSAFGTPRRFVLAIEGLKPLAAMKDEVLGPLENAAYDAEHKPTTALRGFLESKGTSLASVFIKETPKGKRVAVRVERSRKSLAACLGAALTQLTFPKMMRWIGVNGQGLTFPRPLRWVLALEDNRVVPFKAGNIASGRYTYGHRFLSPGRLPVRTADVAGFKTLLKRKHVWLDQEERKAFIRKSLKRFGVPHYDETLVDTVACLVEEPFPVKGCFRKEHLALPPEVLSTCMAKNQKIFSCSDSGGQITNGFVAFLNGRRTKVKAITKEYERVLEARLRDAELFFKEDQKTPLSSRTEQLKQLVFLGKLGTIFDKQERIARLAASLTESRPDARALKDKLVLAARLSKADLMTHMVYEFPELQGVIGAEYALREGIDPDVAWAIRDHYWPRSLRDQMSASKPIGEVGAWLGVTDRLDTLVGAFGSGMELSGSQDPYALRRAAGGVVKIVSECHARKISRIDFSIHDAVKQAYDGYPKLKTSRDEVETKLAHSLGERMMSEWWDGKDGRVRELLESVLATSAGNILAAFERFQILRRMYEEDRQTFAQACKVVERTNNILKGAKEPVEDRIENGLLAEGVEQSLYAAFQSAEGRVQKYVDERRYEEATREYAKEFYQIVHRYFDEVMVNVDDRSVRRNRHALMKKINRLYTGKIADLSYVTQIGEG